MVGNLKNSDKVAKSQTVGGPSKSTPRYENKKKPYSRPHYFSNGRSNPQLPPYVKCFKCDGSHMIRFLSLSNSEHDM